jgi:hypothetical protein
MVLKLDIVALKISGVTKPLMGYVCALVSCYQPLSVVVSPGHSFQVRVVTKKTKTMDGVY